jgi:hypothetical protein
MGCMPRYVLRRWELDDCSDLLSRWCGQQVLRSRQSRSIRLWQSWRKLQLLIVQGGGGIRRGALELAWDRKLFYLFGWFYFTCSVGFIQIIESFINKRPPPFQDEPISDNRTRSSCQLRRGDPISSPPAELFLAGLIDPPCGKLRPVQCIPVIGSL